MQAMHKLGEPTALVKARQADTMLVKEVMEPARKQYAGELLRQTPAGLPCAAQAPGHLCEAYDTHSWYEPELKQQLGMLLLCVQQHETYGTSQAVPVSLH
jgi:hypothetical protein